MEPEQIVERVWPGEAATIEPLGGGITNHNFRVDVGDETFVLRIGGEDTQLLGIDREVGARRLAASPRSSGSRRRWSPSSSPRATSSPGSSRARWDGSTSRRSAPRCGGCTAARRSRAASTASAWSRPTARSPRSVASSFRRSSAGRSEIARRIERRRRGAPVLPCHNDLLSANFIADGSRLWIVDWEYAGGGDPFFDLGNFAVNHELDADGERLLLESYGSGDGEALILMRFMSDFREAMWGVVQQALSTLEFDFGAYADEHFERLQRTAAEPRFRAALG